jgi:DNA-binding NarL/FixJ family response regulator
LTEDRPHRPAFPPGEAASVLRAEAQSARLDARAVELVLEAAGHATDRPAWPDGLTEREVDVLRLVARGWANKQIAEHLALSPKTVGNHLQNLYPKIGVTTRAAAAMYAMRHGLLQR